MRPIKYTSDEERLEVKRVQTRLRVARWIKAHPERWKKIMKRHRKKGERSELLRRMKRSRVIARELKKPLGICECCGKIGKADVHHLNGNPLDNRLSNLLEVCVRCHNKVDRLLHFHHIWFPRATWCFIELCKRSAPTCGAGPEGPPK